MNIKLTLNFQNDVARFLFFHIEDQRLKKNRDTDAVQTLVTELIIDHYKNTVSKSSAKSQIKGLDFLLHFHPYKPFNMN